MVLCIMQLNINYGGNKMKTRKELLDGIRRLTKAGHGGHKKFIEKIKKAEQKQNKKDSK